MHFDMNTCWSRALELLSGSSQLLLIIAGVFVFLPAVGFYLLVPDIQMFMDPTIDQSVLQERMGEVLGPLVGAGLVATFCQFAGYAAMIALMGKSRPTVGEALGTGLRVLPSTIAVLILFLLVYFVGALLIVLPFSLIAGASGAPALGLIGIGPVMLYSVWLMARLSMTMPEMVMVGTLNPVTAMSRSWSMTKAKQWPIMMFWTVLFAIFMILGLLFNGVVGVVAALAGSGTVQLLIVGSSNGFTSVLSGILTCALAVAMYAQLSVPAKPGSKPGARSETE